MVRVGIPRGLLYYHYYPMWRTFFQELGAQVVVSPPTSRGVVMNGAARVVSDTCLPVKVFCGHVLSLVGRCDMLFIPSIQSLAPGSSNCSKFLGLPDMVRAVIPNCPPVLDPEIDLSKGTAAFYLAIYEAGRRFSANPLRVRAAAEAARRVHHEYGELMLHGGLTPAQAIEVLFGAEDRGGMVFHEEPAVAHTMTIALAGHPYVINDEYVNHRLLNRLRSLGVRTVTPEMLTEEQQRAGAAKLAANPYWTFEGDVTGAGGHYLDSDVDGVIAVLAFGCGPDSIMVDVVNRYARVRHKPFMVITLDEHTAEAGLVTRLEAFVDMLRRRQAAGSGVEPCG